MVGTSSSLLAPAHAGGYPAPPQVLSVLLPVRTSPPTLELQLAVLNGKPWTWLYKTSCRYMSPPYRAARVPHAPDPSPSFTGTPVRLSFAICTFYPQLIHVIINKDIVIAQHYSSNRSHVETSHWKTIYNLCNLLASPFRKVMLILHNTILLLFQES